MAKHKFSKTDHRYWIPKLFKPAKIQDGQRYESPFWCVRLQHETNRTTFPLGTSNKEAAGARARDIYVFMVANGWDATLEQFKGRVPDPEKKTNATLGEFLTELKSVADLKPATFEGYSIALRTIVSQMFGIEGGNARYDYVGDGRQKWIDKIHAVKLAEITPAKIQTWKRTFLSRAGNDPVKLRTAKTSVNSLMRRAKSLFAPEAIKHLQSVVLASTLPFQGVSFEPRVSQRYRSTIDIGALISAARNELAGPAPELFKAFILATFCGLRRLEIDRLTWAAFRFDQGILRIQATEHFSPKSEESIGEIALDPELVAMFRGYYAKAKGEFVLESPNAPRLDATYANYRCQAIFEGLIHWLRMRGVAAKTPIHTLRKEFGSLINNRHGIHAASVGLRHANIAVTSAHYVNARPRVTTGLGALLSDTVTPAEFRQSKARTK